jgi:deoxyribodipyrimidine photo-lyase
LVVRIGSPDRIVPKVASEVGAERVLATRDVTPFSFARDREVSTALRRDGRELQLRSGLLLAEPESMRTAAGSPYAVFTPFWRRLQGEMRRTLLPAPEQVPTPDAGLPASDSLPDVALAALSRSVLPPPGEEAAHVRLARWITQGLAGYGERRDWLTGESTSHLGPDLHLGTLSPLQVESAALESGDSAEDFVRQLAWREFYHHQLFHRRAAATRTSDDPRMAAFRSESADSEAVAAWREGMTGIPAVDAGMRQLAATGWLSNRARLVVASFLTRHLLMDYRIGERHFLRYLIDGDVANNLGGWQWTAGVGADAQPWFRIFNPVRQGRRFDADGDWVRRWVPELERVPARYVHAPWEMPSESAKAIGFILGDTYPRPIVDLAEARERALAAFRSISR